MLIYCGKLNYHSYAENECVTIVFPAGFSLNDPVCAHWQWTKDAGELTLYIFQSGIVTGTSKAEDGIRIVLSFGFYFLDCHIRSDLRQLAATLGAVNGADNNSSVTSTLDLQHREPGEVPTTRVYAGKLNWIERGVQYAKNEMVTLVLPSGTIANDATVGLYYQWTFDGRHNPKENHLVTSKLRDVTAGAGGMILGTFDDGFYTFTATLSSNMRTANLHMSTESGSDTATSDLEATDFRTYAAKKALIFRFNTGADNGIFLVQDMLVKYLGFDIDGIEMCYYDDEPCNGLKQRRYGQDAPTVANFKSKFTGLLSSAPPGSVRFVYLDAYGTSYPDDSEDSFDEKCGDVEGWVLAEDEAGMKKEVLDNVWLGKAIRESLSPGVNLTIMASFGTDGGILDAQNPTSGVLLTGCHETQFNVRALRVAEGLIDPWTYAITAVVKKQAECKRSVPAYTQVFNEAKNYLGRLIKSKHIDTSSMSRYRGPSPDETRPAKFDLKSNTSHQDPQLIFDSEYIDPDQERFLFPLANPLKGKAVGKAVRYPVDEL
ncbi:hypothetical protein K488DRAFT_42986 [Vararia minispora EC-137]|uniref:Uncharacterized protein n=1 Tax=Vararia minispora EC-137 TaxID=1314806 RepID=A0ACB8QVK1_9AGAM|nr:hypothetical protein K488DRAFT_42986 [Vararia minispora EC-137]